MCSARALTKTQSCAALCRGAHKTPRAHRPPDERNEVKIMLVPLRAILEATEKYHYAQGAFNVNAVAQAKAAIEVHEMFRSAAILHR